MEDCDCLYTEWTSWSSCDCKTKTQRSLRALITEGRGNGLTCSKETEKDRECPRESCGCVVNGTYYNKDEVIPDTEKECEVCSCKLNDGVYSVVCEEKSPEDGYWEDWSEWGQCVQTCWCPVRRREREYVKALCGGSPASDYKSPAFEQEPCEPDDYKEPCSMDELEKLPIRNGTGTEDSCTENEWYSHGPTEECGCTCENGEVIDKSNMCPTERIQNACVCKKDYVRVGCTNECKLQTDCEHCTYNGTTYTAGSHEVNCKNLTCIVSECCQQEVLIEDMDCTVKNENLTKCDPGDGIIIEIDGFGKVIKTGICEESGYRCPISTPSEQWRYVYDEDECCPKCERVEISASCSRKTKTVNEIKLKNGCVSVQKDVTLSYCEGSCSQQEGLVITMEDEDAAVASACKCCTFKRTVSVDMEYSCPGGNKNYTLVMAANDDLDDPACMCESCSGDSSWM